MKNGGDRRETNERVNLKTSHRERAYQDSGGKGEQRLLLASLWTVDIPTLPYF